MKKLLDIELLSVPAVLLNKEKESLVTNEKMKDLYSTDEEYLEIKKIIKNIAGSVYEDTGFDIIKAKGREFLALKYPIVGSDESILLFQDTHDIESVVRRMDLFREIEEEFNDILGAIHDDFVMIDKDGIITNVLQNFESNYGISGEEAVGKSIFEMEERGIFNPSVAVRVLKSEKMETMLQYTGAGKYLMCTAIPVKDSNGEIKNIISYTTDMTKYTVLKDEYEKLRETLKIYSSELERLRKDGDDDPFFSSKEKKMQNILATIERISSFDTNVLFTGKSGVGKTMYSRLMHSRSDRKEGPFIHINCGAIPENLIESELFGYEKGAFTGARSEGKPGLIELANRGTLFLDEIGDLPLSMQVKLLKVIQDKKLTRIGATNEKTVDFRLITATNKDLEAMIERNEFREDLYYRINIITLEIPSLKDRKSDIFPLLKIFLDKYNKKYGINRTISNPSIDALIEYDWPGNIRELENTVERLVLSTDEYMITDDKLPSKFKSGMVEAPVIENKTLKEILESVEERVIVETYRKHGTTTGVAKTLGISQPSASLKVSKYVKK